MEQPRRLHRIGGQGPRIEWQKNARGVKRAIAEAIRIARLHGVKIPKDLAFFEAAPGELLGTFEELFAGGSMETARGPAVREARDGTISWAQHYNRFNRIPFLIHPEVLTSDEAIVAVLTHEVYEIEQLRRVFLSSSGETRNASDYGLQVTPGRPGNFHDRA
jgi:hypothetical protein